MNAPRWILHACLALSACAKVAPPSGGEVDRLPPTVISLNPRADATSYAGEDVTIEFSKPMDRKATVQSVFIAPYTECAYRWRGRHLVISPLGPLQLRQTYVVTVGTDAADRRGNRFEDAYTFAFSTGEKLDTGAISGRVVDDAKTPVAAHVWAYDLHRREGASFGNHEPSYRTQTGNEGRYAFQRLAPGTYRMLAFVDSDRNGTHDPDEPFAVPASDLKLGDGEVAEAGDLRLSSTARVPELAVERLQALDSRKVLVLFNAEVNPGDVSLEFEGLDTTSLYAGRDGRRIYATTSEQEGGRTYRLASLQVAGRSLEWREPLRGRSRADSRRPFIERVSPSDYAQADDSLRIVFSEAMAQEMVGAVFWVASDSIRAPEGEFLWARANELVFAPATVFEAGAYRLTGHLRTVADLAGLTPSDSLVSFAFEVLAESELCSISGTVEVTAGVGREVIVGAISRERETEILVRPDSSGSYAIDGLLPGQYDLWAFADENGDGEFDVGSLEPFRPSEAYAAHSQTVVAKRGSIVEGVELRLR